MNLPHLPEVERVAKELAPDIARAQGAFVCQVDGPPAAGKSAFLHAVGKQLATHRLAPILVSPAPRALDSGPFALIQIAAELKDRSMVNGGLDDLKDARRPWREKIDLVRGWLEEHKERIVLLIDEPMSWPRQASSDLHFRKRTDAVISLLVDQAACRRVITGRVPEGRRVNRVERLAPASVPVEWLMDDSYWGALAGAAKTVAALKPSELERFSPLEIRLLVAHAAVAPPLDLRAWGSRRQISQRLVSRLECDPRWRDLLDVWSRISLVRRPFPPELPDQLGAVGLISPAAELLRRCVLYEEGEHLVLHDMLRLDIQQRRVADDLRRATHGQIARYYQRQFSGSSSGEALPVSTLLVAEMEAQHHAAEAQDIALQSELSTFFVDQLNALGRALSYEAKRWSDAVTVFRRAVDWDESDDYAHHYLAFNLDVQAELPDEVELHYRRAIELAPEMSRWRRRYVLFLLTLGRTTEAHRAWDDALDAFGLPDASADAEVYRNLHLPVARLLVHRGLLDFAKGVLAGIPPGVRKDDAGLAAVDRRLRALLEARARGAFVPGPHLQPEWWKHAPPLLRPREGEHRLARWMAARVEEVEREVLVLRAAEVVVNGKGEPRPARTEITFKRFDSWKPDRPAKRLQAGDFVEIGIYTKPGAPKAPVRTVARVHERREWEDEDLPAVFPDPARYRRRSSTGE